jgi:hypothetical protein
MFNINEYLGPLTTSIISSQEGGKQRRRGILRLIGMISAYLFLLGVLLLDIIGPLTKKSEVKEKLQSNGGLFGVFVSFSIVSPLIIFLIMYITEDMKGPMLRKKIGGFMFGFAVAFLLHYSVTMAALIYSGADSDFDTPEKITFYLRITFLFLGMAFSIGSILTARYKPKGEE